MKKTEAVEEQKLTQAEKIIATLNGQVNSDKKKLIDAIHSFRENNAPVYESIILGAKLYQILLENGLNESDIINPERLLSKVEGYMYEGNYEMALDIIEVLDAMEKFQKVSEEGNKIYAVSNYVEYYIALNTIKVKKDQKVEFIFSARSVLGSYKLQIYDEMGNEKLLLKTVDEILSFNPVDFNARLYKALQFKNKNLKKYRLNLDDCYNYAYSPEQLTILFRCYADYFEYKKEYPTAYALLSCVKIYQDKSLVEDDLERLRKEMNKTVISPYQLPDSDQIIKYLKSNNLHFNISVENFQALSLAYIKELINKGETETLNEIKKYLLAFSGDESIIKELEKKALAEKGKL